MRRLFAVLCLLLFGCSGNDETVFKGTFLEVLGAATEMVKEECPEAVLFEADAFNIDTAGMTADDIKGWHFVFWAGDDKTAMIDYKDSLFGDVTILPYPTLEDCFIKKLDMDLPESIELMRKADYNDKFVAANVRWPLYPGCDEPYYIYGCPDVGHVFVGTVSKKVTVEPFNYAKDTPEKDE